MGGRRGDDRVRRHLDAIPGIDMPRHEPATIEIGCRLHLSALVENDEVYLATGEVGDGCWVALSILTR